MKFQQKRNTTLASFYYFMYYGSAQLIQRQNICQKWHQIKSLHVDHGKDNRPIIQTMNYFYTYKTCHKNVQISAIFFLSCKNCWYFTEINIGPLRSKIKMWMFWQKKHLMICWSMHMYSNDSKSQFECHKTCSHI